MTLAEVSEYLSNLHTKLASAPTPDGENPAT